MNRSAQLTDAHLAIARVCSVECTLQRSGAQSVGWMMAGWAHAQRIGHGPLVQDDVLLIAGHVDPGENSGGYRKHDVTVGGDIPPEWQIVPVMMNELLDHTPEHSPAEWFERFERIHPFGDGNGRTGLILFNYLNDSLDDPTWPPDPFGDPRRNPGAGLPWT